MLPGLKLTGKNGRNRLGEYPNPRRNRESERGRNQEGRRKYKEEKREQRKKTEGERKKLLGEGRWSHRGEGVTIFTSSAEAEWRQSPPWEPHGHSISSSKAKLSPISEIMMRCISDEEYSQLNVPAPKRTSNYICTPESSHRPRVISYYEKCFCNISPYPLSSK